MSCVRWTGGTARSGARIVFARGAEFLTNVGTGYGGAILNHGELDFRFTSVDDDDASNKSSTSEGGSGSGGGVGEEVVSFTLSFEGNDCGEQEVRYRFGGVVGSLFFS